MRNIATFKEEKIALRFWNFLQSNDIESSLEEDEENKEWIIWVLEEEKISKAINSYLAFKKDPYDVKFNSTNITHQNSSEFKSENKNNQSRFKNHNLRDSWRKRDLTPGIFSLALIIVSVAVFLVSGMGKNSEIVNKFLITENGTLSEILNGELWRIITPIFLHFSIMHILFNMFWLHDLGGQIEKRKGSLFIFIFVLVNAIISNFAQFKLGGPAFGGMSGVVYGLFGYVWIKSKFDPGDGLFIHQTTALIMIGWFFLCFVIKDFGIANWAHAGGLVTGSVWGYLSAIRWNRR